MMKTKTYSFKEYPLTDKIRSEMLKQVDMKKLEQLFVIATGIRKNEWDENNFSIDKKSMNWYLDEWVKNKYLYFIAMKKKLKVREQFEFQITCDIMQDNITELAKKYPQHSNIINSFKTECYINNNITDYRVYRRKFDDAIEDYDVDDKFKSYKEGQKLSKFLSKLIQDEQFDIDLSRILQNRKVKQAYYVSIDPVDILSSSFSKEKWYSCYHVGWGCFKAGPFSMMIDPATMVVYSTNEKICTFDSSDENNHSIDLMSKRFRYYVVVEKENTRFNYHYCQGNPPSNFVTTANETVKEVLEYGIYHGHKHNPIVWKSHMNTEEGGKYEHLGDDKRGGYITGEAGVIKFGSKEKMRDIMDSKRYINTRDKLTYKM